MKVTRRSRLLLRLQAFIFAILFTGVIGCNLQLGDRVRLLPQVRIQRSTAQEDRKIPWMSGEEYSLSLAVEL